MAKYRYYQTALEKKQEGRQPRSASAFEEKSQRNQLNFASNDFLALSQHPHVKKNAIKYVLEWGVGVVPYRLTSGHLECQKNIEDKLADLVGKESALLFPSAYQIREQILPTLINNKATIFIDRFCHHELIQGALQSGAQVFRYEHNNLKQLAALLEKTERGITKWIISESLFGIDGATLDLKKIVEIANTYEAFTFIDDSFSVGVFGKNGMGFSSNRKGIDVIFGSFGKQRGTFGAYLATTHLLREYLLSFNPQLIEGATLPPAVLGAINGTLDLIPDMQVERDKIEMLSKALRKMLEENHWDVGRGESHLIPLICLHEKECEKLSASLLKENILVGALRSPLVPQGAARLHLSVNALHSEEDLFRLTDALQSIKKEPSFSIV